MIDIAEFKKQIFSGYADLASLALSLFRWQAELNPVYREFLHHLDIRAEEIHAIDQIPFLPVELFKTKKIITGTADGASFFESSGTTSETRSLHYVHDISLYDLSIIRCFELFFGSTSQYCFVFLLPSYLERPHASLVYMCQALMKNSSQPGSGFYSNETDALIKILNKNEANGIKTILLGVSFALLDLAEKYDVKLSHTIVIETGGMKGRRKEITRPELHEQLKKKFGKEEICSEYGMTELLSMAYSKGNGLFFAPPWMKILIRDPEDPFTMLSPEKTGCINVVDLANIYSCSFIATRDLGKLHHNGSFEVLGRYDNTDIRGCNLMVE